MTWLFYALAAATLVSVAAILAKAGSKKADPSLGGALCVTVMCLCAFFLSRSAVSGVRISTFGRNTIIFLLLEGLTTGAAILCFFKAIHSGEVTHVVPVVKLNIILVLLFGVFYWHNKLGVNPIVAIVLCVAGILVIIVGNTKGWQWCGFAFLAAVFMAATSILETIGKGALGADLLRFFKLFIAAVLIWVVSIATGSGKKLRAISFLDGIYTCLSGLAVAASWVCLARANALADNLRVSQIYRINLFITVILAAMILKEKISGRKLVGAALFVAGLEVLLLKSPLF